MLTETAQVSVVPVAVDRHSLTVRLADGGGPGAFRFHSPALPVDQTLGTDAERLAALTGERLWMVIDVFDVKTRTGMYVRYRLPGIRLPADRVSEPSGPSRATAP